MLLRLGRIEGQFSKRQTLKNYMKKSQEKSWNRLQRILRMGAGGY